MAVQVRIRNFQSIEDSSITIDGLTAITGTNNSGKTAAMRAIRGVFTNPPAGPLVRHGAAFLSVSLSFDDGVTVVWEKGWEKPDKKGKTVNRYFINGYPINNVGSGVPDEVANLGVRDVKAASDKIWPQIAEQFDGTLFLVNKSGSAVAEALSDVEKVGKLTSALRLSEKDNRSVKDKLKIRREDCSKLEQDLSKYEGLDNVGTLIEQLESEHSSIESQKSRIRKIETLLESLESAQSRVDVFSGFDPSVVPDPSKVVRISKGIEKVSGLHDRLESSKSTLEPLLDFHSIPVPTYSSIKSDFDRLQICDRLNTRFEVSKVRLKELSGFSLSLPDRNSVQTLVEDYRKLVSLYKSLDSATVTLSDRNSKLEEAEAELEIIRTKVKSIIEELGVCPTCNAVHS